MKNVTVEQATREQIAAFLPEAIQLTFASYKDHMSNPIGKDGFEAHHKQAKIAISHIELLIKLAKWADLPDTKVAGDENAKYLQTLMSTAQAEISAYEEPNGEDE